MLPYLLFLIPFALLIAATEWESGWFAICAIVIGLAIAYFVVDIQLHRLIIENPMKFFIGLLVYFAMGAAYSVLKWYMYVGKNAERIKQDFSKYKDLYSNTTKYPDVETEETKIREDFKKSSYNSMRASLNKYRISGWLVWWVPSMFWTFTHDFFKAVWDYIYEVFSSLYERIANNKIDSVIK